jgi:hypothetical protein
MNPTWVLDANYLGCPMGGPMHHSRWCSRTTYGPSTEQRAYHGTPSRFIQGRMVVVNHGPQG